MSFLRCLDWQLALLSEDLESKISMLKGRLLGKKSRWPHKNKPDAEAQAEQEIRAIAQYDPTPDSDKKFMMWIIDQYALGNLKPGHEGEALEDGRMLKDTLQHFINRNPRDWQGKQRVEDYSHWRDLQTDTSKYSAEGPAPVQSQWDKEAASHIKTIVPEFELPNGKYTFKIAETPEATTVLGRGTQWCTSASLYKHIKSEGSSYEGLHGWMNEVLNSKHPLEDTPYKGMDDTQLFSIVNRINKKTIINIPDDPKQATIAPDVAYPILVPNIYLGSAVSNARSYIASGGGPMVILMKDKKPYVQMTWSAAPGDIKDITDRTLLRASTSLKMAFKRLADSGALPSESVRNLQRHLPKPEQIPQQPQQAQAI